MNVLTSIHAPLLGTPCSRPHLIWPGWGAKDEPTRLLIFHAQDEEFGSTVGEVESEHSESGGMQVLKGVRPIPIEIVTLWDEVNRDGSSIGRGWSELSDDAAVKLAKDWLATHPAK